MGGSLLSLVIGRYTTAARLALGTLFLVTACSGPPEDQTADDAQRAVDSVALGIDAAVGTTSEATTEAPSDAATNPTEGSLADQTSADATTLPPVDAAVGDGALGGDAVVTDAVTESDAAVDSTIEASSDASADAATNPVACASTVVGPAGATLTHPSGAKVTVPVGALTDAAQVSICAEAAPSVLGRTAVGPAFEAGPEGQTFLKPVDVWVPFDPTRLSPGSTVDTVEVHTAPGGMSNFAAMQSGVDLSRGLVHTQTTHFSQFVAVQTSSPVFITTSPSLPSATVQASYSQHFDASGGTPPYTWSVPSSSVLPPGLSLSSAGLLSGVPTVPNNFAFFVQVSDSASRSVEMAVSLTVNPPNNPVPSLAQVTPSSTPQGSLDTVIALTGTGFVPATQVLWDGSRLATTFVGATQLSATIAAADLVNPGSHQVSISNPTPGGGTSASVTFAVTPAMVNPVPSIASVSPTQLPISSVAVQITITGTNFIASSSAEIASQGIATNYSSTTQLLAAVPPTYLSSAGTLQIGVFNPAPGGGFSPTSVSVTVGNVNPTPTLVSLSPSLVTAGSGAFTLVLSGSNFVQGAQAFFGSTALTTTFVSATSVQAAIPAYLVSTAGSAAVVLVNPTPGGGSSGTVSFVIQPAVDAGGPDATMDASGDAAGDANAQDANDGGGQDGVAARAWQYSYTGPTGAASNGNQSITDRVSIQFTTTAPLAGLTSYMNEAAAGVTASSVWVSAFSVPVATFQVHTDATGAIDSWFILGETSTLTGVSPHQSGTDWQAYSMNTLVFIPGSDIPDAGPLVTGAYDYDQADEIIDYYPAATCTANCQTGGDGQVSASAYGLLINPSGTSGSWWTMIAK